MDLYLFKQWVQSLACTFIFGGSKITADGDCSQEIKRPLLLGRKALTNLDSILKSRDITLPTKVSIIKAMVFPVIMYRCERWTIKKTEQPIKVHLVKAMVFLVVIYGCESWTVKKAEC